MTTSTVHAIISAFTGVCIGMAVVATFVAAAFPGVLPAAVLIPIGTVLLLAWLAVGWLWLTRG